MVAGDEQQRFYERLHAGFASAVARAGEEVRELRLAGTSLCLRFAGAALQPAILDALADASPFPAENPASGPRCEIHIWDSESTHVPPPPPPRPRCDLTGRGEIWGFTGERYRSSFSWVEGSVSVMDRQARRAVYWLPSHRNLPPWLLAAPLRTIFHWWMELNGRQLVHAAAVGQAGRGVLVPGRGGAGKSSTAIACLENGLDFVSDDYLVLALDPEPRVFPVYATAKLDARSLALVPEVVKRCRILSRPGFDKAVLFLREAYRDQLCESLPVQQVLYPKISPAGETSVGRIEPREVVWALASETLAHLPHSGPQTAEFLERVVRELPSRALLLGTDRSRIPPAIRECLAAAPPPCEKAVPADPRPYISLFAHFPKPDQRGIRALASAVLAQDYARTELLVTVGGASPGFVEETAKLPGLVRVLRFADPVCPAVAWNRAIREAFADYLMLLEPGDRPADGALEAVGNCAQRNPAAAWVRGKASVPVSEPLRGTLVRKSAFLQCGLFNARFEGREQQEWLARAIHMGLFGAKVNLVSLQREGSSPQNRIPQKSGVQS